jgi:NAD(P)-dependent dehydrogenase (short-subunit alcohol dehydrogenase family)
MRKVLITGATSGFGKLLVEAFLKNGDLVIATGRNLHSRKDVFAAERHSHADKIIEVTMDVTDKSEVEKAVREIEAKCGAVDILVNNAGYGLFGALEDLKEEEIRYQMEVNFFGTVNVTKAFLPLLRKSKGKIFNFSSVFGFMGFPLTSLYCASKYAVEGLTESLRGELAPHGVQVCLIEPGGYRTNFGNSLAWSAPASNSVYKKQFINYQKLRDKLAARPNPQSPSEVSDGLLKLSLKSKLPMRKVFGKDGRASHFMKSFLPSALFFSVMDSFFKKVFMKEAA